MPLEGEGAGRIPGVVGEIPEASFAIEEGREKEGLFGKSLLRQESSEDFRFPLPDAVS